MVISLGRDLPTEALLASVGSVEVSNATSFFGIKEGRRLVDQSGSDFRGCTKKAEILAIGVSLDKPAVDPMRRFSVLNADSEEIPTVPVFSKLA